MRQQDSERSVREAAEEAARLRAAADAGWVERERIFMESLIAFKRAGADGILTYASVEVARALKSG